jgi:hypothetical protein
MAAQYGAKTTVLDWREPARLFSLRQPAGRYGGEQGQVARVKCARGPLLPPRIMSRQTVHCHLSLLRQPRGDLVVPNASQCPPVHPSDP